MRSNARAQDSTSICSCLCRPASLLLQWLSFSWASHLRWPKLINLDTTQFCRLQALVSFTWSIVHLPLASLASTFGVACPSFHFAQLQPFSLKFDPLGSCRTRRWYAFRLRLSRNLLWSPWRFWGNFKALLHFCYKLKLTIKSILLYLLTYYFNLI